MTTTVLIEGLTLRASVGIHAAEKSAPQRVVVDLELATDCPAPARDAIEEAVCYETLATQIRELVAARHYNLLETLAAAIAALAQSDPRVRGGRVTLRKPDILPDAAVGVRVTF